MRLSIDTVRECNKVAEVALCYTGDILDPRRDKYDLKYYVDMAKELAAAGANIIAIKDMAGLLNLRRLTAWSVLSKTLLTCRYICTHMKAAAMLSTLTPVPSMPVLILLIQRCPL